MAKKPHQNNKTPLEPPVETSMEPLFKKLFLGLIGVLLILLPLSSTHVGINGDERFQVFLARYIVPFYTSFGNDKRMYITKSEVLPTYQKEGMEGVKKEFNLDAVPQADDLKNYGCGFEFFSGLFAKMFGYTSDEQIGFHTIRHVLLAITTFLILLFAGLTSKELLGWRAAFITVVLLLISPRFIGHGLMNSKDIPFALGYIAAVYFMARFLKQLPMPSMSTTVGVMLGIAAAINIRIGGLMLMFYFGLFAILFWFYYQRIKNDNAFNAVTLRNSVMKAFAACFFGYFLGLVLWPYGLLSPISNPLAVLKEQSQYPTIINQLFEGVVVSSKDLPSYYLSKFIFITYPIVTLLGLPLAAYMVYKNRSKLRLGLFALVLFVVAFPLFYISYTKANVYNGCRHILFLYAPLTILAALGYDLLISSFAKKGPKIGAAVLLLVLCLLPAKWIVAEHPHEYVYFNEFEGGIENAYGYYVTDYWMLSVREASDWLVKNELGKTKNKVVVASDCVYPLSVYLKSDADSNVSALYSRYYDRNNKDWDYAIFYSEYVSPYQLQHKLWPPDGTIYTVKAGGVPICAVVKRTTKADLEGHNALQANNIPMAIEKLEQAKTAYPNNEGVYTDLGLAYLSSKNFEKGIEALSKSSQLYPDNPMVYYYLGIAYAQISPPNYDYTQRYMRKALQLNPDFKQAQDILNQLGQMQSGPSQFR